MAGIRCAVFFLALTLALKSGSNAVVAMTWESGWSALVTGSVFCDQCLKQEVFPFGLPLNGAKVLVQCYDGTSVNVVGSANSTTDLLGGYLVSFKGISDLGSCKAFVSSSPDSSCSLVEGGGQTLSLKSKFFSTAFYVVDPLFYKPSEPRGFCPGHSEPRPPSSVPPLPPAPPGISFPPFPPFPNFPPFPPFNIPPFPWKETSTCASETWLNSAYFCHWKKATPFETTVGKMFGKAAQKKYGKMSVYTALQSEDELLKEAVAATMNSYTNEHFYISPKAVRKQFNAALGGDQKLKWDTAWSFKQANNGYGKGKCLLSPCGN